MSTCLNGGVLNNNGTCTCPPGTGSSSSSASTSTCSSLTCGNAIEAPLNRPSLRADSDSSGCQASNQCSAGWTGLNCNVCTTATACTSAMSVTTSQTITSSSVLAGSNATVVCSSEAYTYSEGFLNCDVLNPTLQAVYSGSTTLLIQKTVNATLSLAAEFGQSGTLLAQLWYSPNASAIPIEQFYCSASSCNQQNASAAVSYTCSTLSCTCIPGAIFCGGPGSTINIASTVDQLTGPLEVDCSSNQNGSCSFKQSVLDGLFGNSGLVLSSCRSGECIQQGIIDAVQSTNAPAPSDSLSGGVIAGLAVLGGFIVAAVCLVVSGKLRQRKARKGLLYDTASLLQPPLVGLHWQDVGYTLPSSRKYTSRFNRVMPIRRHRQFTPGKVVLSDVSGQVAPGSMLAILGPSGAGKSTLIDILAGKRKSGRVSGSVSLVNANQADIDVPARISYVDQEDVLPATSTVREALVFAAELKLPESITRREKLARVDSILRQLRLESIADSRIGSSEKRGISGGERRRLSIGLELMSQPSILLLDEPTSGLDAVSAMRVVEVLRTLSGKDGEKHAVGPRTTVIASIHQPSSQIIYAFDTVSVLTFEGRQIYAGPVPEANGYFAGRGQPCPPGYNIADHLLELASFADRVPMNSSSSDSADREKADSLENVQVSSRLRRRNARPMTTLMTQFEAIALRDFRELKRDLGLFGAQVVAACAVGLFVGGMYYQQSDSISGFQNRVGSLFFLGSLLAFWAMSALANLASHKALFLRERAASFYNPGIWLLSRALFDLIPLRVVPTILVSTIVYWMSGLYPGAAQFFKYLLIALLFAIAEALLNLLLAAAIRNLGIALLLSALINLFQMALAGFFVSIESIPGCLKWLNYLDPLRYALEALTVNEINTGLMIQDTIAGVPVDISAVTIMQLLFSFDTSHYYRDVLVLFAFIAGFGVLLIGTVTVVLREIRETIAVRGLAETQPTLLRGTKAAPSADADLTIMGLVRTEESEPRYSSQVPPRTTCADTDDLATRLESLRSQLRHRRRPGSEHRPHDGLLKPVLKPLDLEPDRGSFPLDTVRPSGSAGPTYILPGLVGIPMISPLVLSKSVTEVVKRPAAGQSTPGMCGPPMSACELDFGPPTARPLPLLTPNTRSMLIASSKTEAYRFEALASPAD